MRPELPTSNLNRQDPPDGPMKGQGYVVELGTAAAPAAESDEGSHQARSRGLIN